MAWEEEDDKAFKKKKVFENLKHDYKNAKEAKVEIDELQAEWNEAYNGEMKNLKNRSKYKSMEIAKQIEKMKTQVSEPFTNTSHPVRVTTTKFESRARIAQKYLNSEFTANFDRVKFMDRLTDVLFREGTVWVKTSWDYYTENHREVIDGVSMEEIMARGENPDKITQDKDRDTFTVEYNRVRIKKNNPNAVICRNEHVFPDPSARVREDLRFLCFKRLATISEMRQSGKYSDKVLDKLIASDTKDDTHGGSNRDSKAKQYGFKEGFNTKDDSRKSISIIEYYGYYDLDGDGIAEPIFASWADREDVNLILEENDQPTDAIPFHSEVYSGVSFSIWGNALAYFIQDNQNAKSGIVRGIMDNLSLANNGQKFVQKGTMDYINFKRMTQGEKWVQTIKDPSVGIRDGQYSQVPGSVFSTYEVISKEASELSGNNGNGMSLGNMSEDRNNQLTEAQLMTGGLVLKVSSLLGKMFGDWISMASVFLENEQIEALFTAEEQADLYSFEDNDFMNISFKVGTNAQRQVRLQQLNMLMQQAKVLGETIPPELLRELVAEMYELFDMYDKAEALRKYVAPPNPVAEAQAQHGMRKLELDNLKIEAEIEEIRANTRLSGSQSQKTLLDGMSGASYKKAQETEKYKKAEAHSISSSLDPARAMVEMEERMSKLNQSKGINNG